MKGRTELSVRVGWVLLAFAAMGLALLGFWGPSQPASSPEDWVARAEMPASEAVSKPTSAAHLVQVDGGSSRVGPVELEALCTVGLSVHGDVWLKHLPPASGIKGSLEWGRSPSEQVVRSVTMTATDQGTIELPGVPAKLSEFQRIHLAGLVFRPVRLRVAPVDSPELAALLEVEAVPGATLVWSDSTPTAERVAVEVALTGRNYPYVPPDAWQYRDSRGRVSKRVDCQLPYALPQLAVKESVWIGGGGRAWRAFSVDPDDVEVKVQLSREGSIRVLHDGPRAQQSSGLLSAILQSHPAGVIQSQPISDEGPLLFDGLANGEYHVWLALGTNRQAEAVSPTLRLVIDAADSLDADLTEAFAAKHLGAVRLHVSGSEAAMEVADVELGIRVLQRAEEGAKWPWVHEGPMRAVESGTDGVRVFEKTGLVPGDYVLVVEPMGTRMPCTVLAGEEAQADLRLPDPGWLILRLPEGYRMQGCHVSLKTIEARREDEFSLGYNREIAQALGGRFPLAPGSYRADIFSASTRKSPLTTSVFVVNAGEECVVEAEVLSSLTVHAEARETLNQRPVALPLEFWTKLDFSSASSGDQLLGRTRFHGDSAARTGISLTLTVEPQTARLTVPESPLWTFEPVEPFELRDGMTVTLRATAK